MTLRRTLLLAALALAAWAQSPAPPAARFVLLGDRTGETVSGMWEQVWKQALADRPAFAVGVGDSIQGGSDATADAEWRDVIRTFPSAIPFYVAPGNHDVWSDASVALFEKYTHHPLHYSFDRGPIHVTILDTSRSDQLPASELAYLESDLAQHAAQPLKFIVTHRPFWVLDAGLRNTHSTIHQLAKKYGVQYIVAGHIHQLLHVEFDGVTYFCAPSAGGHLRASEKYEDGWFFGYTLVTPHAKDATFEIKELNGRVTSLADWGLTGLTSHPPQR